MHEQTSFIDVRVGLRVRELREKASVSIDDAASLIGVSPSEFGRLERGEMRLGAENMWSLAENFGVGVSAFFDLVKFPAAPLLRSADRELLPARQ